jgi:hypothetical protein
MPAKQRITDDRSEAIFRELARRQQRKRDLLVALHGGFEVLVVDGFSRSPTKPGYSPWKERTTDVVGYLAAQLLENPNDVQFCKRVTEALASELNVLKVSIHGFQFYRGLRRKT